MKTLIYLTLFFTATLTNAQTGGDTPLPDIPNGGEAYTQPFNPDLEKVLVDPPLLPATVPPSTAPPPNTERKVFWIHGLGGDKGSWGKAAQASEHSGSDTSGFEARKLQSEKVEYTESAGLLSAADDVRAEINSFVVGSGQHETPGVDPNNNFIIAHSQGGLVSKTLIYKDFCSNAPMPDSERYYGGLVTFGSALKGAQIINSLQSGLVDQFLNSACEDLTEGFIEDIPLLLNILIDEQEIQDGFCGFFNNYILDAFLPNYANAPILNDYKVGADWLETINDCTAPAIQKVAFYGEEPQFNILWRTAQYFLTSPNAYPHWEANDDRMLADQITEQKIFYFGKAQEKQAEIDMWARWGYPCSWWEWVLSPIGCAVGDAGYWRARDDRDAYLKGLEWLVDADENWQAIIGALDVETITVNEEYSCQCNTPEGDAYDYPITDPDNCPDNCELLAGDPVNITIQVTKPNDGVVLKESASYMTGATADPVKLENSSHMQMRNDEELKRKLTNLYNGNYGIFFKTESRTE